MNPLEIAGATASIITAIIAVIGIYPLFRSLKQSERSLRFNVYNQVLEMLEQTRQARHLLYDKVPKEPSEASLSQLSPDETEQLDELVRTFDKLGLLVKHGVVPLDFVLDFYSYPIVVAWHRLEPHVTTQRRKRNQPGHMVKFEMLAIEAKKHRDRYHPGEETFTLTNEQMSRWRVWHK
jgi:cytochrome c-type biogenesis protein CcmH/NrfG